MRLLIFFFILSICKQASGKTYQCDTNAPCGCSTSSTVLSRIVGGEAAVEESWSWAVSLRKYGSHSCGGSIISPLFIITAAHCIHDITDLASVSILAGSVTLVPSSSNKLYQIRSIAQIYKHSDYDRNQHTSDIALLRLSKPLDMTRGHLKPICLPTGAVVKPADNINMVAVGWGATSMLPNSGSQILRQVTVRSIAKTSSDCQSTVYNSQVQFCGGLEAGGKDTCQGDSGGPLMEFINGLWQLDGLTSYGNGCALPGKPGVYTRVSSFIKWIKSITQPYEIKTANITKNSTTTTTTKKPTTATIKKGPAATTTTTYKKTSPHKWLVDSILEMWSNTTESSIKKNPLSESLFQTSNSAKHSTVHSLFVIIIFPIITSVNSFILLFLL